SMVRAARQSPGAALAATSEAKAPEEPAAAAVVIPAAMTEAADAPNGPTEETAAEPDSMDTSEQAISPADPADEEPAEGEGEGEVSGGSGTIAGAVADEPIRLDEPEPARSGRSDEEEDGSLRELFWGEE
ncbi:MAG TPA: hypothetical protein VNP90_06590, partial [Actinomycetota bacterium]|nr:hypothetical protein [Actinomycetota bacterium]